ncbi:hypothetical protein [Syntrophothermus lipocalidus]|uniref:Uncharacterized protein n=1 Tax=Syntrophothermus lipocalidus (strain DSM 12680 / TGB-C1) TaxID=643648 RepID=D7CPR4_SYNLT|nr:hypothetical protein [Syntrophothermus lipocalidus]ADI02692.1 hypothetical protein Slip_1940 [Syntrophothermus lipocalidus DSM 12680]
MTNRWAIFGTRSDGTSFLAGCQTYKTKEEAEERLLLLRQIFKARGVTLYIRPF